MLSFYPDAVAVKTPVHAQNHRPPGWTTPGLTAQLSRWEGFSLPMLAHRQHHQMTGMEWAHLQSCALEK